MRGADEESRVAGARNFFSHLDFAERSHLGDEGIVGADFVLADNGEREDFTRRNVLLCSCSTHTGHDALDGFELRE